MRKSRAISTRTLWSIVGHVLGAYDGKAKQIPERIQYSWKCKFKVDRVLKPSVRHGVYYHATQFTFKSTM